MRRSNVVRREIANVVLSTLFKLSGRGHRHRLFILRLLRCTDDTRRDVAIDATDRWVVALCRCTTSLRYFVAASAIDASIVGSLRR